MTVVYLHKRKSQIDLADDQAVGNLKKSLGGMVQAYDEQVVQAKKFKATSMQLQTEMAQLERTCNNYLTRLDTINTKKLKKKCLHLVDIMNGFEKGKVDGLFVN